MCYVLNVHMSKLALFGNKTLIDFVNNLKLDKEDKGFLIEKIPELELEERVSLLETLIKVYFLDREEEGSIERLKQLWPKE